MNSSQEAFGQAPPPGLTDSLAPAIQDTPRFQLLVLGEPSGEEARLWQQYQGTAAGESSGMPGHFDLATQPDGADEPTALLLFVCENASQDAAYPGRQLLDWLRPFPVVVATLPAAWAESPEWANVGKFFSGRLHARAWADLAHTCLELDQRQLTLGGNPALEDLFIHWRYLRSGRQIERYKRDLLREKDRLLAVRLVLGLQMRQLQDKKEEHNPSARLRQHLEGCFQQLEQFLRADWEAQFHPESGDWMQEIKKAISTIERFPQRGKGKKKVLYIEPSTLHRIHEHFQPASAALIRQFDIYTTTTLALCAQAWELEWGKFAGPPSPPPVPGKVLTNFRPLESIDSFEASIVQKGLKELLMAGRQAPMYLFMIFSVMAMSGVSIYPYRTQAWFQVLMLSLVILGIWFTGSQNRQEKQTSIEEAAEKAREVLLQGVQKQCEESLKECLEVFVVQNRNRYLLYLEELEQQRKLEAQVEARKKLTEQKFLEESIRAKTEQEKQLEYALRQLETLEKTEQKAWQDRQRTSKLTQNSMANGTDRRINAR